VLRVRRQTMRGLVVASVALFAVVSLGAQQNWTVWDGVYTTGQAQRGRTAYEQHCGACHGVALAGRSARALAGDQFLSSWSEDTVSSLFEKIQTTMPPSAATRPGDADYRDIVAYILQANGFPAAVDDAAPAANWVRVRIQAREGPGPVPAGALVRAAGCLQRKEDGRWMLEQAGEPVRTRDPEAPADAPRAAGAAPHGRLTLGLMGIYPSPDPHVGQTVEVRGFLIRDQGDARINVTSLIPLGAKCERR
jgi:mono/diheme cytochrome c family protein